MVVIASLYFSISYSDPERDYSGMTPASLSATSRPTGEITRTSAPSDEALQLERLRLRQEIEFLNGLPGLLGSGVSEGQRETVTRHVREIKLRLMDSVWADDWSDPDSFRLWAEGGAVANESDAFGSARTFFEAGAKPPS
jgi:hypothetical protein